MSAAHDAFEAAWRSRLATGNPALLDALLRDLTEQLRPAEESKLQKRHLVRKYETLLGRLRALERWPARDPRIARAAEELLVRPPWAKDFDGLDAGDLYAPLFALLVRHGDVATVELLTKTANEPEARWAGLRSYFERMAKRALAPLVRRVGRPPRARPRRRPDDLLAQVLAAPDDRELRQVCADWLLEKNDPRGELMSLQLQHGSVARQRELIALHGREWVGALRDVTAERVFVDGMLDTADLRLPVTETDWDAAAAAPELATVRRLGIGAGPELRYRAFVLSPAAISLRDIDVPSRAFLELLCRTPSALPGGAWKLACLRLRTTFRIDAGDVARLEQALVAAHFPALTHLEIHTPEALVEDTFELVAVLRDALRDVSIVPGRA